jgi:hypothetical protein
MYCEKVGLYILEGNIVTYLNILYRHSHIEVEGRDEESNSRWLWYLILVLNRAHSQHKEVVLEKTNRLLSSDTTWTHRKRRLQQFFVAAGTSLPSCYLGTIGEYTDRPTDTRVQQFFYFFAYLLPRERVFRAFA